MDDTGAGVGWAAGGWGITPEVRGAMLLHEAREALNFGDPAAAVAMAEEALEDDPDDVEALLLVADAAARAGQPEVAVLAAAQARKRGAVTGAVEAAALLGACQVEEALVAADSALLRDTTDARSWAVRGQALELLGLDGAQTAFDSAHALHPERFPRPLDVSLERWPKLYLEALGELPDGERAVYLDAVIRWEQVPALADLRALDPPAPPGLALLGSERDGRVFCTIYRTNLTRGSVDEEDVLDRLTEALATEARILLAERRELF